MRRRRQFIARLRQHTARPADIIAVTLVTTVRPLLSAHIMDITAMGRITGMATITGMAVMAIMPATDIIIIN